MFMHHNEIEHTHFCVFFFFFHEIENVLFFLLQFFVLFLLHVASKCLNKCVSNHIACSCLAMEAGGSLQNH